MSPSKITILFFFLASASCLQLFAQNAMIDSLRQKLKNEKDNSKKIDLYYDLHYHLLGYNIENANQYLEAGYTLAKKEKDTFHIAGYFYEKAGRLFELAKYDEATLAVDSSIILYETVLQAPNSSA